MKCCLRLFKPQSQKVYHQKSDFKLSLSSKKQQNKIIFYINFPKFVDEITSLLYTLNFTLQKNVDRNTNLTIST